MRKLYRSRKNRVLAGVCGGIAEYFDVDPVLIRLIAVLFFFTGGVALIAYIVGIVIIPNRPQIEVGNIGNPPDAATAPLSYSNGADRAKTGSLIMGLIMIGFGMHFLLRNIPFFHTYYWWFWDIGWKFFWPSVLILVGLFVIFRGIRR